MAADSRSTVNDVPGSEAVRGTSQPNEWRANWQLILVSLLGISAPVIAVYALGQFMAPLEQEFGWTRTQVSVGLSISLLVGFLTSPLIGRIIDRFNARPLALAGLVLLGVAISSFSLATGSMAGWIALWCFHALASALIGPTIWIAVVSSVFERNRSLAIAVCLCGTALGSGLGPIVTRALLDAYDWRTAFQILGMLWVIPTLIATFFFFHDRRPLGKTQKQQGKATGHHSKGELKTAFLSPTFIRIALSIALTGTAASAFSIHLVPILSEEGLDLTKAASIAGIAGISSVLGKVLTGAMFDRFGASLVAILIMTVFALSCLLFALHVDSTPLAIITCGLFGLSIGANFTLGAILASKLFSTTVFGVVYGALLSVSAIGTAIGPLAISKVYDTIGTYGPAFWAGVVAAVISAFLLVNLRKVSLDRAGEDNKGTANVFSTPALATDE